MQKPASSPFGLPSHARDARKTYQPEIGVQSKANKNTNKQPSETNQTNHENNYSVHVNVGLVALAASAADINWQTPITIFGASDVNTSGTLVGTWAPGDDVYDPDSHPVNGVTFNAYGSGPFNSLIDNSGNDGHYDYFNSHTHQMVIITLFCKRPFIAMENP
ncbi:MAG: hypothetical protein WDM76_05155 [Limisphaerales bacterium]